MNAPQTRSTILRARLSSRMLVLALGLPFVGVSAAQAKLVVEGSALQLNSQASNLSQTGLNIATPLPVIGVNGSKGTQNAATTISNSEHIPFGTAGVLQGSSNQGSTQGATTAQGESGSKTEGNTASARLGNDQLLDGGTGGIVLGDAGQRNTQGNAIGQSIAGSKAATGAVASDLNNRQIAGDATGIIIGSSSQGSSQGDNTAQAVAQKESNPKLGDSKLSLVITTTAGLQNLQGTLATTIIGTALQGNTQGHNGSQTTSQAPSPVITGNFAPTSLNSNHVTVGNCQLVVSGLVGCLDD